MKTHDQVVAALTKGEERKKAEVRLETLKARIIEDLVEIREALELTQGEVARRIGMTQQMISRIENAENVTIDTLLRYMDGLRNMVLVERAKISRKNSVLHFIDQIESEATA